MIFIVRIRDGPREIAQIAINLGYFGNTQLGSNAAVIPKDDIPCILGKISDLTGVDQLNLKKQG